MQIYTPRNELLLADRNLEKRRTTLNLQNKRLAILLVCLQLSSSPLQRRPTFYNQSLIFL